MKAPIVPKQVIIPTRQYLHRVCKPVVKVGDYVLTGEVIAEGKDRDLPPIHSSISGTVREISSHPDPFGKSSPSLVIDSDGKDKWVEGSKGGNLEERILENGIVETYGMHRPLPRGGVDTVILNGTDHRPYVFVDRAIIEAERESVLQGLHLMMEAHKAGRGIIGINESDTEHIRPLVKEAEGYGIQVVPLKMFYTRGMGRLLSRDLSHTLKNDLGKTLVSQLPTARAVYEAIEKGKPFIETSVSVYGAAESDVSRVRIGTTFKEVVQRMGGYKETPERIFMNSPMTGIAQYTDEVPVVRATYGIVVQYDVREKEVGPCIRCAQCVDACPVNLLPNMLALYSNKGKFSDCRRYNVFACIECGYCSYTCPSKIPIMQLIRFAKSNLEERS
jgi:electron transport complex protein RnfC